MDKLITMDHEHDVEYQLAYSIRTGFKEGFKESFKEGIKEGKVAGKNEMIEKIVSIGIQQKVDLDLIAKMAGITAERVLEIRELLKEIEIDLK